ncbi:MAG: DegQ family serine endoprotease [Alphaproteobacteria bacterium]|nr:DegQ family serine endoprotease [Alphaproteobacteria bacterium]MDD9920574.1 DegQ family serine endoprotease [Alphaproteobacteria bacterium]
MQNRLFGFSMFGAIGLGGVKLLLILWLVPAYAMTDYADLVERLSPSVVNISTETKAPEVDADGEKFNPFEGTPFEDFFKGFGGRGHFPQFRERQQSTGSGVVISKDGYVVTNNHVIEGADEIIVRFNGDREEYPAELIGRDSKNDLALLKLEDMPKGLQAAELGDSDKLRPGQAVLAIGNPFGLGGTVTAGIVSALGRNIGQGPYDDFIQTDAAINPGNSGGPLFSQDGDLVGINTAILTRTGGSNGIGFAIPVNTVKLIVAQIKKHGHPVRGWLGVRIQQVTPELAENFNLSDDVGALVAEIVEDSPAEAAKIQVGDIIMSYNGTQIEEMADLPRLVAETEVGQTVTVNLLRNGSNKRVYVKIAELEEEEGDTLTRLPRKKDEKPTELLGLSLQILTKNQAENLDLPEDVDGLVVVSVDYNSPAAEAGLRRGDVLVEANMKPVSSMSDLEAQVDRSKGKSVLLRVFRRDGYLFIPLAVED